MELEANPRRQVRFCADPDPSQGSFSIRTSWTATRGAMQSATAAAPIRAHVGHVRAPQRKGTAPAIELDSAKSAFAKRTRAFWPLLSESPSYCVSKLTRP